MPKVIPGETLPYDEFIRRLRDAATWMVQRCESLGVSVYPPAQQLLEVDDDVLRIIQTSRATSPRHMDEQIMNMHDDCLDYIAAKYGARGQQALRQEVSNNLEFTRR